MKTLRRIFALGLLSASASTAQDPCAVYGWGGGTTGLNFVSSMGSGLNYAMDVWSMACGPQAPSLSRSSSPVSGLLNITVEHLTNGFRCDDSPDACACANQDTRKISIFDYSANGGDCGGPLQNVNLAHEIGHFLGFADVNDPACGDSNVMWHRESLPGVTPGQCILLDNMWQTDGEDPCDNYPPPQGCDNGQDPTPIVIDLERDGFRFTSPDVGVEFDLDADGVAEKHSWVGDPRDAFLWRDLNGNGLVDDGGELFGNSTVLMDGTRAVHGFEALAELDFPNQGGNGDGIIDQQDWGYHLLELWLDWNLNGVSDEGELVSLAESPVRAISLKHLRNRRQDRFGNLMTYWSKVWLVDGGKLLPSWAVDVFFQYASP